VIGAGERERREKRKAKSEKRKAKSEKRPWLTVEILPGWGAAVLRPY